MDRPGINRLNGRLDLVYDDWLYPVFEAIHLAQPRSIWLQRALYSGGVDFVITKTESPNIDGLGPTLTQLGYRRDTKFGTSYYAWRRVGLDQLRGADDSRFANIRGPLERMIATPPFYRERTRIQ